MQNRISKRKRHRGQSLEEARYKLTQSQEETRPSPPSGGAENTLSPPSIMSKKSAYKVLPTRDAHLSLDVQSLNWEILIGVYSA